MEDRKQINFKPSDKEMKILEDRCADMGLTKTAVLRELIRKLGEENAEDSRAIAWLAAEAAADSTPSLKGGACVSLFGHRDFNQRADFFVKLARSHVELLISLKVSTLFPASSNRRIKFY